MTGTKLSNIQLPLHYETHLKQTSKLLVEVDEAERNRNNVIYLVSIIYSFYITTTTGYLLSVFRKKKKEDMPIKNHIGHMLKIKDYFLLHHFN